MSKRERPLAETTPFPNFLLDQVRPTLKGSEWNFLCVIVRQTNGWSAGNDARKQADWLTHRQLKQRTGLASASICRAIAVLIEKKLIIVSDGSGKVLDTAAKRRRSERLYFSLCLDQIYNTYRGGQTASQKLKTTKEIREEDIIVDFKNENRPIEAILDNEKLPDAEGDRILREALHYYERSYAAHFGAANMPPISPADIVALHKIVQELHAEQIKHLLDRFFTSTYHVIARQHHSLSAFIHSIYFLRAQEAYPR